MTECVQYSTFTIETDRLQAIEDGRKRTKISQQQVISPS